jgi:co-chaperonin GroES (HSP10)
MSIVKGKIVPLNNNVLVTEMSFDEQKTAGGIVILSDDGKAHGVKPRWCRVWAIGPEQREVKVGDWILVEHGRWTRGVTVKENDQEFIIRRVDPENILMSAEEKPSDVYMGQEFGHGDSTTIRPEDFGAR